MKEAQKVAMEESKTRWMASQPDGRVQSSQKGGGKENQVARTTIDVEEMVRKEESPRAMERRRRRQRQKEAEGCRIEE